MTADRQRADGDAGGTNTARSLLHVKALGIGHLPSFPR